MEDYNHFYYENLVLAGGNTRYTGLKERLKFELEQTKVDKNASVSVSFIFPYVFIYLFSS